jgi:GNAT superfamily N-acetyltransferase
MEKATLRGNMGMFTRLARTPGVRIAVEAPVADQSQAQRISPSNMKIRRAAIADAPMLANAHIRGWQWAYSDQLPVSFLEDLANSLDERITWWSNVLNQAPAEARTWVVEVDDQIVGFASAGPCSDPNVAERAADLYAIYLLESFAGRGIGRALMEHTLADLRARGYQVARLWVLASNNRARRFYAATGWEADGATRVEHLAGVDVQELRYAIWLGSRNPQI